MIKDNLRKDTVTLMLSYYCNTDKTEQEQALCVKKCAKLLNKRVIDKPFRNALRALRNTSNPKLLIAAIQKYSDLFIAKK